MNPGHPLRAELTWLVCSLELWHLGEKSSELVRRGRMVGQEKKEPA